MKIRPCLVIILFFGLIFNAVSACAQEEARKVTVPKKIEYDGMLLSYNPAWQDEETYLEVNTDADPEPEVILSFVADYKTESDKKKNESELKPFQPEKQELLPVYNYVFYHIYDRGPDKKYRLIKTLNGLDRPGQIQLLTLEKGQPPAIVIISPGGSRYKDIQVLQWQEGGYRSIFNRDTRKDASASDDPPPARIVLGDETYLWNNASKAFEEKTENTHAVTDRK